MKRKARKPMGQIPPEDLSLFCQQTALILRSAIPLEDGLFAIAEGLPKEGAQLVSELGETVSSTGSFSGALEKAGVFPSYLTSMAVIGESSGKLEEVLTALGEYYDRESRLKRQIRSAILYPMLSVLLMTAVIGVLVFRVLTYVLPIPFGVLTYVFWQRNRSWRRAPGTAPRTDLVPEQA